MNLFQLALNNIRGNAFRSWVVALCALLVSGFALGTTLILQGAENSLQLASSRLGADIVVVPEGSEAKVEGALLMGTTTQVWMDKDNLQKIGSVPGVAAASPQLYLTSLHGASCCTVSDMFLVAFEPATDFTIEPWLVQKLGGTLHLGEAIGGKDVFVPYGDQNIRLYGYILTLRGNLEPTGTGLDNSMFVTFNTAQDMARISLTMAKSPLVIPPNKISAVMVKVAPGYDPHQVAVDIFRTVPGVTPIEGLNLFQSYRSQINGLLKVNLAVMGFTWLLSVALIGLVFMMAADERRRELGVLRALGATRRFVLFSLLAEAGFLALVGSAAGIALTVLVVLLFRTLIMHTLNIPFLFPSGLMLAAQIAGGLLLALLTITLAAFIPAYRISRQEPASAMRE
jgi:putative ABC transport system permease protein